MRRVGSHRAAIQPGLKKENERYNLETDLGEQKNLAAEHPEIVSELHALMLSIENGERQPAGVDAH